MAQDPESDEELQDESSINPSHELDMVQIYSSQGAEAETEADVIHGVLESNGIPSLVVRAPNYPVFEIQIRVPRGRLEEAKQVIAEAKAFGPAGAAEAEAASEEGS